MKTSKLLYLVALLCAIGCSRKAAPAISLPPTEKNNCCADKIQALLDSVKNATHKADTSGSDFDFNLNDETKTNKTNIDTGDACSYYKIAALQMSKDLNDAQQKLDISQKETEYYKALAQSRAKKIVNNYNSNNKNTNIGDGNVNQDKVKGPANVGDGNVNPYKPKQSQIGDGNKQDNRTKDRFWLGVLVTCAVLFGLKRTLAFIESYFPASIPFISIIKKILP